MFLHIHSSFGLLLGELDTIQCPTDAPYSYCLPAVCMMHGLYNVYLPCPFSGFKIAQYNCRQQNVTSLPSILHIAWQFIHTIILLKYVCLSQLANCRSQVLLDRLGRCIKLFVSAESTSCREFASQVGLDIFLCAKNTEKLSRKPTLAQVSVE